MPLRVVCVGAGLAGLSVAITLREDGATVTILEAAETVEQMNIRAAGLALYPCGTNILRDTLGLDPVGDCGMVRGEALPRFNWANGSLEGKAVPRGGDWFMAHRGALFDGLLKKASSTEAKGAPVQLLMGKKVTELDVENGKVTTADGSVYEGDLIVGSDGVRSQCRKAIVAEAIVQPSGYSIYRWILTPSDWAHLPNKTEIDALVGPESRYVVMSDAPDKRLVIYRCHESGIVNGGLLLPDHYLPSTSEDWSAAGSVDHLQSVVQDLHEPLKSLMSCVKSCGLWQLRKQRPLRTWSKGKAIILGDAAHPMLPFQAVAGSLAMEDAEALQYSLRQVGCDPARVPEAIEMTYKIRFLRASVIQHLSNSTPFEKSVMEKAEAWSLERASSSITGDGDAVPIVRTGDDDEVQQFITNMVGTNADVFDTKTASQWVMQYKSAANFCKTQPGYVLEKTFV